jgi:microcystin-dependent protein
MTVTCDPTTRVIRTTGLIESNDLARASVMTSMVYGVSNALPGYAPTAMVYGVSNALPGYAPTGMVWGVSNALGGYATTAMVYGVSNALAGYATTAMVWGVSNALGGYATTSAVAAVTNSNPPGTVISFAGASTPSGYLLCDGSSYATNAYANLFVAIGYNWGGSGGSFNVPDLRGYFLRGWSGSASNSVDPDVYARTNLYPGGACSNTVGSYQWSTNLAHTHGYTSNEWTTTYSANGAQAALVYKLDGTTLSSGGSEARPKNAYVLYCIKF